MSCKQGKRNSALFPEKNDANLHNIRTSSTSINVVMAVVWSVCIFDNAVVLGVESGSRSAGECTSKACQTAASRIKSWMDTSEKPCNNFFQFACGGWIKQTKIPDKELWVTVLKTLATDLTKKLKKLLESKVSTTNPQMNKLIEKARKDYRNCINVDAAGSVSKRLSEIFSYQPLPYIEAKSWRNTDLETVLADLETMGIHIFMKMIVGFKKGKIYRHMLKVDQPPISEKRSFYTAYESAPQRQVRMQLIDRILKAVYEDLNIDCTNIDAKAILDLEIQIATATTPKWMLHIKGTDNLWTVSKLKSSMANFDWRKYLDRLLAHQVPTRKLPDDYVLQVTVPDYFRQMDSILENADLKHTVGQLATFLLVEKFYDRLTKKYQNIFDNYNKAINQNWKSAAPWQRCVHDVTLRHFEGVLSRLYSQEHFDHQSKEEALKVVKEVRAAFYERLKKNKWLGETGRALTVRKGEKMILNVGFPQYIYDADVLEKGYGWINVRNNVFIMDDISILQRHQTEKIGLLWKTVDKNEWLVAPLDVNGHYVPYFNRLYLPMALMEPPYFNKDYPKYLNYGGIGVVIGHEITHGFDDRGRHRDEYGNRRDWWPNETVTSFQKAAKCFVDQYDKYAVVWQGTTFKVHGVLTQAENIAEDGGIRQAFQAYRAWIKKHKKAEPKLPGLDYTPEQLFFINYGQSFCSKMTGWGLVQKLHTDDHTPDKFRIIGSLSNIDHFHRTFNCRPGDKMNPPKKCSMW